MSTTWIASSEKIGTTTLSQGCAGCPQCFFTGSSSADATPGGFAVKKGGAPVAGEWKKALLELAGVAKTANKIQRRNLNDFIRHVPVGILTKGTRLLHVSARDEWVKRQLVGGHVDDDYSFFTLENRGPAAAHGNRFLSRVQLTLTQDVHCFFASNYLFKYWHRVERGEGRTHRFEIDNGFVRVGGELTSLLKNSWPANFRPVAWASCSECEISFHNSVIPRIMKVSAIATWEGESAKKRNVENPVIQKLNTDNTVPGGHQGVRAPWWMSPYFHSRAKVVEAQERYKRRNIPLEDTFFE
jgi:hypothetical protein